jgi:hypothetical protein
MQKEIVYTNEYALLLSDEIPTTWYYDSYSKKVMHTGGAEYAIIQLLKVLLHTDLYLIVVMLCLKERHCFHLYRK